MKFQELRTPTIHDLERHVSGSETLNFPATIQQPEEHIVADVATDNVVIDLRETQTVVNPEEDRVLQPVLASVAEGNDPRPPRSNTPPVSPTQAQRVLDSLFSTPDNNGASPAARRPDNSSSVLPLTSNVEEPVDESQIDWSRWEEEIQGVGVRVTRTEDVSTDAHQEANERIETISKLKALLRPNQYMFRRNYFEESGGSMSRLRILLGHVEPICRVEDYGSYIGKTTSETETDAPMDIVLEIGEQIEGRIIQKPAIETKASERKNTGKFRNWILTRSVEINEVAGATIEKAKSKKVLAVAAAFGGVAISLYLINRYGTSSRGNSNYSQLASAIGDILPKRPPAQVDQSTEWYNIWAANNPGGSVEQFNDIINSQSFADMCNNPDQFAVLASA